MKRQLTAEQTAARDARREKFKVLWRQVKAMPELARIEMANKLGLRTVEGHELSLCNTMLVATQLPGASVLGGFRQWLKQGRAVRKGEHGAMIWVPCGAKKDSTELGVGEPTTSTESGEPEDRRFIIGTVFDIGQTEEIEVNHPVATVSPEIAKHFGMANLPNVRVELEGQIG